MNDGTQVQWILYCKLRFQRICSKVKRSEWSALAMHSPETPLFLMDNWHVKIEFSDAGNHQQGGITSRDNPTSGPVVIHAAQPRKSAFKTSTMSLNALCTKASALATLCHEMR
jgi:hypothetical protein